jgi:serine/threonine protein kinase
VVFCVNPGCHVEVSEPDGTHCPECGTTLLLCDRFELRRPLRKVAPIHAQSIFLGYDRKINQECIIKVLDYPTAQSLQYFEREAGMLGNIRHPGLPKLEIDDDGYFTVDTTSRQYPVVHCLVMEKIDGIDLEQYIRQHGKISQTQAIEWLHQLTEILAAIHERGAFHRDIKPANIMLKPDGKLVLIDFGAAREVTKTYLCKLGRGPDPVTQTHSITVITSAGYTPYEQTQGKAIPQSDFYALGRTMVALVTGKSALDLIDQAGVFHWRSTAPHVSPPLADFLDRLMALMPVDRPRDTEEIFAILNRLPQQIQRHQYLQSPWTKVGCAILTIAALSGAFKGITWYFSERYLNLSLQSALAGNLTTAKQQLESAIFYAPNNPKLHANLAVICQRIETPEGTQCAIKHYERSLQLNVHNSAEIHYNLGNLYEQLGELEQAKQQYSIVLKAKDDFAVARNNLARLLILEGQYQQAQKLIQPELSRHQDVIVRSALLKNLGWVQYEQKQYAQSVQSLKESVQLNPTGRTDAYCLLAKVHEARPKLGSSGGYWQSCLSGVATTPEVQIWQSQKLQKLFQPDAKIVSQH